MTPEIQRHNSDQMLKTNVGTTADPRKKFQPRKTVSTPSLNFDKSSSADDHLSITDDSSTNSALLDSSRSQQRSSSIADTNSLVIHQKKKRFNKMFCLVFIV